MCQLMQTLINRINLTNRETLLMNNPIGLTNQTNPSYQMQFHQVQYKHHQLHRYHQSILQPQYLRLPRLKVFRESHNLSVLSVL